MTDAAYWEARAKARQAAYDRAAAEAVQAVASAEKRALATLTREIDDILRVFSKRHGLTGAEAKAMLESPAAFDTLEQIKAQIAQVTDEGLRRRLQAKLESNAYGARLTRAEALKENIAAQAGQVADVKLSAGRKALQTSLFDAQNRMMYDIQKGIGRMFVYAQMPVSKAQEVLSQRWLGGNYSGRVWTDTQKLAQEIETCVMENTMAGKTSEQTYQNLLDLCGQDMRKTNRLIRTETSYAANQGEKYAYEQANIKEYEFVSALEARTCEICGGLDGKRFPVNASKPGKNFPPMHPHCRCTTMPYDKDLEAILTDEDTRWARDPETGKAYEVPMSMTYEEWKKKQQEISGIDSVEIARKKMYNHSADMKQLEAYQERIGVQNMPKSLDEFQKIKYNDSGEWEEKKKRYAAYGDHSDSYSIASAEGGRHHGKFLEAQTFTEKQLKKASESYFSQVEEHYEKMQNPSQHDSGWATKTEQQKNGLLRKWEKDLSRNSELHNIMETALKERRSK